MAKKKHHETCMHCAFIHAFVTKYPSNKKANSKEAMDDMTRSALKVATLVYLRLDAEDQAKFLATMQGVKTKFDAMVEAFKGPTKH